MTLSESEQETLARFLIHADTACTHKDDEICLAADLVYGWGPSAADWESAKTPAIELLHRLLCLGA